ncbi:MAG: Tim44 domain-containing protein [Alphaproteobacteria bacterium]|nr:Tim44 domain-containing protein [Alphaproteobacteria bacterium]
MSSEGFPFLDILFFALIALFIILRLRAVLGRRTGNERKPFDPFNRTPERREGSGTVIRMPGRSGPQVERDEVETDEPIRAERGQPVEETPEPASRAQTSAARSNAGGADVRAGFTQIKLADPSFDPRGFLSGAEAAYGMIVEAFARGDTATLRPLLSDDVYDRFAAEIRTRLAAGKTQDTEIESLDSAEIVSATMQGRTAVVAVRYTSKQKVATRSATGEVIAGDPDKAVGVTEEWQFTRNTRSRDPNWSLAETKTIA